MDAAIFTPVEGDKFAAATPLPLEVMTVKPSGFINYRGIVPAEHVGAVADSLKAYFKEQGRPEPVVFVRTLGAQVWTALDHTEIGIPDSLPDNFQ